MIALFDTSTLIYLLKPDAPAPFVRGEPERVSNCAERINYLLSELQKDRARIVIPTPVIAELLVRSAAAGSEWLRILTATKHFHPAPFDILAAVECAAMSKRRLGAGKLTNVERAKAKFDEQIVAIARVERASVIYSEDGDIRRLAGDDIEVLGVRDLPLPPQEAQGRLELEPADQDDEFDPPDPERK